MADEEHVDVQLDETPKVEKTDDEIKVEVEEAAPPKAAKNEKAAVSPDEGIDKLKRKFEMERSARAEAERRAAMAEQYAQRAQLQSQGSDYQTVVAAIETDRKSTRLNSSHT